MGTKFVFNAVPAVLLPDEYDCGLCVKALGPIAELVDGFWDRLSDGLDRNAGIGQHASCLDLGVKYGGAGNVKFRVFAVRAEKQ